MSDESRRAVSSGKGAPPPRRAGVTSGGSVAPPPRTASALGNEAPPTPAPTPARTQTVVGPADSETSKPSRTGSTPATEDGRRRRGARAASGRPPWWLRVAAWIVAVPLGLALVGIPARRAGYLSSQKLLDILIGRDTDRYLPLVVIVLLWALVTAVLVQLIVEGGGWLIRRRRARKLADVGAD